MLRPLSGPALEAAVRSHVFGKRDNKEPLTADDVKNLSGIKTSGKAIKNLSGLENLIVYLTGNPLSAAARKSQIAELRKFVHTVTFEAK